MNAGWNRRMNKKIKFIHYYSKWFVEQQINGWLMNKCKDIRTNEGIEEQRDG